MAGRRTSSVSTRRRAPSAASRGKLLDGSVRAAEKSVDPASPEALQGESVAARPRLRASVALRGHDEHRGSPVGAQHHARRQDGEGLARPVPEPDAQVRPKFPREPVLAPEGGSGRAGEGERLVHDPAPRFGGGGETRIQQPRRRIPVRRGSPRGAFEQEVGEPPDGAGPAGVHRESEGGSTASRWRLHPISPGGSMPARAVPAAASHRSDGRYPASPWAL